MNTEKDHEEGYAPLGIAIKSTPGTKVAWAPSRPISIPAREPVGVWIGVNNGRIIGYCGGNESQAREFLTAPEHPDVALWWFNQPISLTDAAERIPSVRSPLECTSFTRPASNRCTEGQLVRELDTGKVLRWNDAALSWEDVSEEMPIE
jgi:hypothetical protein